MSTFDYSQPHRRNSIGAAVVTIVALVTDSLRAIRDYHEARLAIRHLHSLSDSDLKDIGVHRCQIELVVNGLDLDRISGAATMSACGTSRTLPADAYLSARELIADIRPEGMGRQPFRSHRLGPEVAPLRSDFSRGREEEIFDLSS
jgi:uncharacterized protein YjiS (DUF1127 family)